MTEEKTQEPQENINIEPSEKETSDGLFFGIKLDSVGMQILENAEENDEYKFKLENFDGPLDLLLHLIKVAKIDIKDIFVSKITEQYMIYMEDIDNIDVDKASEFILMAARLVEIKSNKLLPKPAEENPDEEDPEQRLIRQIEEYKLFKEASEKLKEIEDVDRLYKQPDDSANGYRYELPEHLDLSLLTQAFYKLLTRETIKAQEITERKIVKDRFTVAQKIAQIKDDLITKKHFKFSELFETDYSKSEIINTFLALLELLKGQFITASQSSTYGEIEIFKKEEENK
ncbi:MAG: segregation/condensation protein A [Clostridia bacterium]|nr:segregation/condensation protein A [Clostridia bacterium]